MQIVEIVWMDSAGMSRWHDGPPQCGLLTCHSVGMLAEKTRKQVTIVQSGAENDTWDHVLTVPRANVTKLRVVGRSRFTPESWLHDRKEEEKE